MGNGFFCNLRADVAPGGDEVINAVCRLLPAEPDCIHTPDGVAGGNLNPVRIEPDGVGVPSHDDASSALQTGIHKLLAEKIRKASAPQLIPAQLMVCHNPQNAVPLVASQSQHLVKYLLGYPHRGFLHGDLNLTIQCGASASAAGAAYT